MYRQGKILAMDISASINTFGDCEVKIGNDMSKELVVRGSLKNVIVRYKTNA
jgi:hypothetical protein